MKLVVVESPAKAKTIEKYLGHDYKVIASKGHIIDLPKSELGVDPEANFKVKYIVTKAEALKKLKQELIGKSGVLLAVDPDREGEAIGWHIAKQLKLINDKGSIISKDKTLERIAFTEITKDAIQEAIKHPRKIDFNLVNAQQARRILDRLVGYKLSPLLWKKIRFGLSAGRVQSVAVRLIVDRETEIEKFNKEEYWQINAYLSISKTSKAAQIIYSLAKSEDEVKEFSGLKFELNKIAGKKPIIPDQKTAQKIVSKLDHQSWIISAIESKKIERSPKSPFITSTFQQAASNRYGMSAKEAMRIAQKLYEAGQITYMRTDSNHLATTAIDAIRKYIVKGFGQEFLSPSPRIYSQKGKLTQEAHEAIRPTDVTKTAADLKITDREARVYNMIRNRTIASQMQNAIMENTAVKIEIDDLTFQLNGQRVLFKGFLAALDHGYTENLIDKQLSVKQELYPLTINSEQSYTKPPARYTEASLIKALENYNIGRPSTYAPIISTILARKYVEKQQRNLVPTDTGKVVNKLLNDHFPEIVDTDFTAQIEDKLDAIAQGEEDWKKMLGDFYFPFEKVLLKKEKLIKREDYLVIEKSDKKCPECGKRMDVKLGRYGRFLSCQDFPKCKGMLSIDGQSEEDIQKLVHSDQFKKFYLAPPKTEDGRDFLLKVGRFGKFWAHPDYPKVKDARPLSFNDETFKAVYGNTPKANDGKKMILRRGKFGEFWAHPDYPEVKEVIRIKAKEIELKKQELGIK